MNAGLLVAWNKKARHCVSEDSDAVAHELSVTTRYSCVAGSLL